MCEIWQQYIIDLKMPYLLIIAWEYYFYLKTVKKSRGVLLYTHVPLKSVWHNAVHTQPCLPSPPLYQPRNWTIPSLSPQGSLFWSDKTVQPGMKGGGVKFHEEMWYEVPSHSEGPELMFAAKFLFQRGFFFFCMWRKYFFFYIFYWSTKFQELFGIMWILHSWYSQEKVVMDKALGKCSFMKWDTRSLMGGRWIWRNKLIL